MVIGTRILSNICINISLYFSDTSSGSEISTGEMHNKMMQMQTDVENLVETANKLIADKEGREVTFNVRPTTILIKQPNDNIFIHKLN